MSIIIYLKKYLILIGREHNHCVTNKYINIILAATFRVLKELNSDWFSYNSKATYSVGDKAKSTALTKNSRSRLQF